MANKVECILWDFGDTLADERLMWPSPDNALQWTEIWKNSEELGILNPWMKGEINLNQAAESFAQLLPISKDEVISHMKDRCKDIFFFPKTWEFVTSCGLPQAIVTINPDIFDDWIVPNYNLGKYFNPIIASYELKTLSKAKICLEALKQFSTEINPSSALLIDNKEENIKEWAECGGAGYLYKDDNTFHRDIGKIINRNPI